LYGGVGHFALLRVRGWETAHNRIEAFMRLTLRTLLAYLDDVLDPADKEELAHKIQSSEFAEDLVHKTRDTVRRLRLSAPQVIGTGMGLDPNTVAEYLDNVMPPDQVGDFERICLESDVHLAEAAACHHVLTMVLGQPADIDPIARQRMYTIANEVGERKQLRIEPAHTPGPMATSVAVAAPGQPVRVAEVSPAPRVEIPEYLRAGSWWRSWGVVAGLAAVVLVGIALLLASGAPGWFGKKSTLVALTPESAATNTSGEQPSAEVPTEPTAAPAQNEPATQNTSPPFAVAPLTVPPHVAVPGSTMPPQTPAETPKVDPTDRYAATALSNNPAGTPITGTPGEPTAGPTNLGAPPAVAVPSQPLAPPPATQTNEAPANGASPVAAPPAAAPAVGLSANAPGDDRAASENGATAPLGPVTPNPAPPANPTPPAANGNATANLPVTPAAPPNEVVVNPAAPPAEGLSAASAGADPGAPAAAPDAGALAVNTVPGAPETPNVGAGAGVKPRVPAGPPELGTYIGGKTVLLRYDGKSGAWFRVEPRAAIVSGEKILALPEFRPKVAMISGLHLDMSGGTQVVVDGEGITSKADAESAAAAPGIPSVDLVYGRIVLVNPTDGDKKVRLKLGPIMGEAQLAKNSTLAVEVERKHVPGADPRKEPAPVECRLYAPDGGVVWKDAAGSKAMEKAARWTVTPAGATEPVADMSPPEWIYHEPIGQLSEQRYGAPKIESTLLSNVPVDVQLLELFQGSKQKEVKSLVARSSTYVGQFEPFVKALGDSEQKATWKTHIDTLRSAMALSPESANKVWQTLVDQRGRPAAGDLFEMLCGYSADAIGRTPEQMKTGAVATLIDRLEDNSLDYRVLAVQDLAEITGKRLMSNPAANQAERTLAIRKWRARLEAGDLKPVAAP
jgi:hypothetical protein